MHNQALIAAQHGGTAAALVAVQRSAPAVTLASVTPTSSLQVLLEDGQLSAWFQQLSANSTTQKERKALVRNIQQLLNECATRQRSDSSAQLCQQVAEGEWLSVENELPAPYEEVRILVDDSVRIARLAHDKSYFQLASYMGSAKQQYVVSLARVQGWQPVLGIPGTTPR